MKLALVSSFLLPILPFSAAQCVPGAPLSNNIITPFSVQVQNTSYPVIHNRLMNFWQAGGGDNHLYLSPAGNYTSNHTLAAGVLTNYEKDWQGGVVIRAVVNGEYTVKDNTTKIFMTQRGDPRAYLDVREGCNPDTGLQQTELYLRDGGDVCVRLASGDRWEFRHSPKGNPVPRPGCLNVNLAVIPTV